MFDIREELKKLPKEPGVYIMRDAGDSVLYVGKAVNLHNRVYSYFRKIVGRGPQIDRMVQKIDHFEYIVTDSELEALVLENNLIKEHRPPYNTMLKDDKTYPYIKVTVSEDFPRVLFSREMKKDKSRYFGPFTSAGAVRETIDLINKLFLLRTCNRKLPKDQGLERPCLNYHIHQCHAPCQGWISKEDYRANVERALQFLSGDYELLLGELKTRMEAAAEALEFEKAQQLKETYESVQEVAQRQKISNEDGEDRDVIAVSKDQEDAVVQVFFVRNGKLIGREHYYMTHVSDSDESQVLGAFVKQFYAGTPFVPKELMLQHQLEDAAVLEEWLTKKRGARVRLLFPKRGDKEKLVELAAKNAELVLSQDRERIKREEGRTIGAAKEIAELLGLPQASRMEAFDISNISGFANVGSMVVFEKGKPKKSDYRKFRIKSVTGPDDYACMREVLTRRFTHGLEEKAMETEEAFGSFTRFPDLLMMDGGKGQVNIALEVLAELKIDIPVCGMVKDDNHRTRGLYFHNEEIPIDKHSEGFQLITRIQDEAHRFAIEFHRSLRSKAQIHSVLDEIPGVGPKRRKALQAGFSSIEEIKQADVDTLAAVPGLNKKAAEEIWGYFHKAEA
ncbi:MAG: excinuclease ABC subunit UvrC [Lachnospiraceae bacterium]|nr:excinuclease ABC subunit UvrC [Lachnospiraceae bacterium]